MHSRSHTGEKPHKCKHCPYAAADSSSLKKHLRIHYDERPFKCQICPYASRNSSQLTVHLRSHTGTLCKMSDRQGFCYCHLICCPASFLKGDAPFQCQQCEAKFKINSDLKRHLRIHSGEKPYKCDFCEYRCAMKGNLKSHVQIKHGPENSFQCQQCDFKCASRAALRQHSRHHQPVQSVQCSKCTYSCSSKAALRVHERMHSEERPFKCDLCSFASKRLSNLLIHKKKCHLDKPENSSGAKPGRGGGKTAGGDLTKPVSSRYRAKLDAARAFCCDLCDASFVREDSLRSHKKQHRDAQQTLELQLCGPPHAADALPVPSQTTAQLDGPVSASALLPYSSAQLKIILSPLGQQSSLIPADVDGTGRTNVVLLSPENQDMVVNSVIHQVNLLAPAQPLGSSQTEAQTVLLAQLTSDNNTPIHQAVLQTAGTAQDPSSSPQTLLSSCSDLEGLSALIHDGSAELRVVTKDNSTLAGTSTPPDVDVSRPGLPGQEGALLVPDLSLGGQDVVVHSVPLLVSTQSAAEQLTPHTHWTAPHSDVAN